MDTALNSLLARFQTASVAVLGDFALDAYWHLDPDARETSLETGLPVQHVRTQTYSPGGAGNVCANLAALGATVHAVGCLGADPFGPALIGALGRAGVDTGALCHDQADWQTPVYAKPQVCGVEQPRIDFGAGNRLLDATIERVVARLAALRGTCEAVVINQQLAGGLVTPAMIRALAPVLAAVPTVVVDARHRALDVATGALKLNLDEARGALGCAPDTDPGACALLLARRRRTPVFVTQGGDGMVCADADSGVAYSIAPVRIDGEVDPVGAGDTVTAVLAAALAAGATPPDAAQLAVYAAAVVVRKLGTTGTATPDEIREVAR